MLLVNTRWRCQSKLQARESWASWSPSTNVPCSLPYFLLQDQASKFLWHLSLWTQLSAILWCLSSETSRKSQPIRKNLKLITAKGSLNHGKILGKKKILFDIGFFPNAVYALCCGEHTFCGMKPPPFRTAWKLCWTLEFMVTNFS